MLRSCSCCSSAVGRAPGLPSTRRRSVPGVPACAAPPAAAAPAGVWAALGCCMAEPGGAGEAEERPPASPTAGEGCSCCSAAAAAAAGCGSSTGIGAAASGAGAPAGAGIAPLASCSAAASPSSTAPSSASERTSTCRRRKRVCLGSVALRPLALQPKRGTDMHACTHPSWVTPDMHARVQASLTQPPTAKTSCTDVPCGCAAPAVFFVCSAPHRFFMAWSSPSSFSAAPWCCRRCTYRVAYKLQQGRVQVCCECVTDGKVAMGLCAPCVLRTLIGPLRCHKHAGHSSGPWSFQEQCTVVDNSSFICPQKQGVSVTKQDQGYSPPPHLSCCPT